MQFRLIHNRFGLAHHPKSAAAGTAAPQPGKKSLQHAQGMIFGLSMPAGLPAADQISPKLYSCLWLWL